MIKTYKHLCYRLDVDKDIIPAIINELDQYYYNKSQPKMKFGRPQELNGQILYRHLQPSINSLKVLQKRINKLLQQICLPDYAYGSVKRKNNIMNATRHFGNSYLLSIDLKNYFSYITNKQVYQMFVTFGFSPDVARILAQLTTYNGKLPQGPPTSPIIANLVFVTTGLRLQAIAESKEIIFSTYLDDITFSSKRDFKELTSTILEEIKSGGFRLNHRKIYYKKNFAEVTGILMSPNGMTVESDMKERSKKSTGTKNYMDRVSASGQAAFRKINS